LPLARPARHWSSACRRSACRVGCACRAGPRSSTDSKVRSVFGFDGCGGGVAAGPAASAAASSLPSQSFRDRIDLGRIRLLLDRLRLFLGLCSATGFADRAFLDAFPPVSAARRAVSVTTGGFSVILPTRLRPVWLRRLFPHRLRIFFLAGFHAGHDLGELIRRKISTGKDLPASIRRLG